MSLFALTNCDVHEFPVDRHALVPFTLHLDFDTEMYFYKEIPYTRGDNEETKALATKHDVRYVINAYRTDNIVGVSHTPDTTFVFTKSDLTNLNYTANFEIREGTYRFAVWCDFVDEGSTADKYYNTSDFLEVILKDRDNHPGSNDFRDTFKGYATAKVIDPQYYIGSALTSIDNSATAQMTRPMGKVQFISTDVKEFISRMASLMQQQGLLSVSPDEDLYDAFLQSVDLGQFKVIINYDINMPCSYDMVYDKPSGIWENMSFVSRMNRISESEMILGFDYVFVDEFGTTLNFSIEVYDRNDKLMSRSNSVQVPIMPSKLTVVKGEFLTSIAEGGITIKPGYDGEWNWDITDVIQ
jgi:hypothetical protein